MEISGDVTVAGRTITSARSTKLSAAYSHEDSGSSVARGEEGGIV